MLEKGGAPDPKTVYHLDRCLSCLSCMTTCAVQVDYMHLIDRGRIHIERHYRRPLPDRVLRMMLAKVLPRPMLFSLLLRIGRTFALATRWLPRRLRVLAKMLPDTQDFQPDILAPSLYPAEGPARKRVALLAGCAQQVLCGNINAATIRLLRRHSCDVVVAQGAGCCGSLTLHMGREREAKRAAQANIEAWEREREKHGLDAIVINASGCGTTVKDYGHLFARDPVWAERARRVAGLARDVSEFVHDIGLKSPAGAKRHRVTYHDPCSIQHGQRLTGAPRELLRRAGFQVIDVPEKHFCCGSAGTYNLLQPEMAEALGRRKARHVASTDPDILATGNIGCMVQLRRYLSVPIVHMVELLDWATGGPRPPALDGVALRTISDAQAGCRSTNPIGIW
jgi:glycolate dehydrogenase iron-sulfur subunit